MTRTRHFIPIYHYLYIADLHLSIAGIGFYITRFFRCMAENHPGIAPPYFKPKKDTLPKAECPHLLSQFRTQIRVDKHIDVAVHDVVDVSGFGIRTVVFYH